MPTTGQVLTYDSTKAGTLADPKVVFADQASSLYAPTICAPTGMSAVDPWLRNDLSRNYSTVEVDTEARAVHLIRAPKAWTTITCATYVDVAQVNADWCEVAICKGTPGPAATVKLTRLGYADAKSALGSTGERVVSVTCAGMAAGDELWIVWSQKAGAGSIASMRAGMMVLPESGLYQYRAATQPSTMASDTQFGIKIIGEGEEPAAWVVGLG
jgi:hypothetical protein